MTLDSISMWSVWLILTIALAICEIFSMAAIALCLAIATACGLAAAVIGLPTEWQLLAVAASAVASLVFLAPVARKLLRKTSLSDREAASNMDALIGRKITLPSALGSGDTIRVKIDGDNWQVKASDPNTDAAAGSEMTICGYDSIVLLVE